MDLLWHDPRSGDGSTPMKSIPTLTRRFSLHIVSESFAHDIINANSICESTRYLRYYIIQIGLRGCHKFQNVQHKEIKRVTKSY